MKLQWVPVSTAAVGTLVNEAFTNGSIDFAGYGDLPSVVVNASGTHTRLIVPGGVGSNTYLVVPAGSTAKSIVDLKGKRIALNRGRPWEVTFSKLLAENGLKLSDFKIYNLDPQAGAAAVAAGRVDGFFTLSDAYSLVDKQVGKIIWSTKTAPDDWKMRAELWASDDFVRRYPDLTQLVATAYVRAAHWISQPQNRDAYVKILSASGQPESIVRREYADEATPWKDQWAPLFTPALTGHYRDVIAYSRQAGLTSTPVDVNALLAPTFVSTALKQLGNRRLLAHRRGARREPLMPMHALASTGAHALRLPGLARLGGIALWWATPVAFVALWWLASAQRWFPPQLVVPPERLAATLRTLLDTGELRDNLLITLHRLALGFAIGATGGAAFGILLARSRLFADYLRPTFDLLRQVPTLTLIPLLILLIGVDEPLKLVVVGKAVFFPVALAAYTGVHDAPRDLVEMARHYGARPLRAAARRATAGRVATAADRRADRARARVARARRGRAAQRRQRNRPDDGTGAADAAARRRAHRRRGDRADRLRDRPVDRARATLRIALADARALNEQVSE